MIYSLLLFGLVCFSPPTLTLLDPGIYPAASPFPPQTPGPTELQSCQEQLPPHRRCLLEGRPEVRRGPPQNPSSGPWHCRRPCPGGFNERFASPSPPHTTLRVFGRPLAALKGMEREPQAGVRQDVCEHLGISRSFTGRRVGAGGWAGAVWVYTCSCFPSPPPGSLIWLWPGRSRRLRRSLLGN